MLSGRALSIYATIAATASSAFVLPLKSFAVDNTSAVQEQAPVTEHPHTIVGESENFLISDATQSDQIKMFTIVDAAAVRVSTGVSEEVGYITAAVVGGAAFAVVTSGSVITGGLLLTAIPTAAGAGSGARAGLQLVDGYLNTTSAGADDLFITVNGSKAWPVNHDSFEIASGETLPISWTTFLTRDLEIQLWDRDSVSGDDLLSNPALSVSRTLEPVGDYATRRIVAVENRAEGSAYLVAVQVSTARSIGSVLNSADSSRSSITMTPLTSNGDLRLAEGSYLRSDNGQYKMIMQDDGNLVLYTNSNEPIWSSGTYGRANGPFQARMQDDGNFVVYDRQNQPIWSTGTNGQGVGPYRLVLQDDRNIVLYDANNTVLWSPNTYVR